VREDLRQGDFVLITDHILLHGPALPDLLQGETVSDAAPGYWSEGAAVIRQSAEKVGLALIDGVLLCVTGPTYETRAEIEMARRMGSAVVAMSLAPEALIAWSLGIDVAGLSLVTNIAGAQGSADLHHDEVVAAAARMQPELNRLLREAVPRMLPSMDRSRSDP
jgi:purine-nucleoside phosphorylase